MNRQLHL